MEIFRIIKRFGIPGKKIGELGFDQKKCYRMSQTNIVEVKRLENRKNSLNSI